MSYIEELGKNAKRAERSVATASARLKNDALTAISKALIENIPEIISANSIDLDNAVKNDMSVSLQDRLMLNEERIRAMASSVMELVSAREVVGAIDSGNVRPNGLRIMKTRVPLGVIGIIYEARPNVTVDAATLCLKAGNVVILRGGKEAFNSNRCLTNIMRNAISQAGLPADAVALVEDTSRESANEMMRLQYLDVLIPRGGAGLISAVCSNATVPVIQTGVGNCHVYVDASADLEMAVNITDNAKTQRPSVCNAIESLLVHKDAAESFLPMIAQRFKSHKVIIKGCENCRAILGSDIENASDEDYATEFGDYIIAVKVVENIDEAIEHISKYGTGHSECIVTRSLESAERFKREIDAAAVYVNASTRFTDGGEFGFGAEIGISTQKLHARGPMGLNELTSVKYLIEGDGQIR
ncbi:MAG: glutamate-5-semialdehyde dehydrogenase [Oscillospiraceae bacterium]|nr:glutamate-5-semialdehyde dehydrogenase [Oscillospiraceae bacterium]